MKCLRTLLFRQRHHRQKNEVTKKEKKKKKNCKKEENQERLYSGGSGFRHSPKNALSNSGSVALTPISAYTLALPCATVMREWTMQLRASVTDSEGKYAIVRKCNPLTMLEHPLEAPTCYICTHARPWQHCSEALKKCCIATVALLCCDDFMVNKPAWRKNPIHSA